MKSGAFFTFALKFSGLGSGVVISAHSRYARVLRQATKAAAAASTPSGNWQRQGF